MTIRSDSTPPRLDPEVEGLLVDRARGELGQEGAKRLDALLGARPEQAILAERVAPFLEAAREALPERPEQGQTDRIVARVRAQVEAEASRERREASRQPGGRWRLVWARVLAVSVAVHVLLLGFLVVKSRQIRVDDPGVRIRVGLPAPGILPAGERVVEGPGSPWLPDVGDVELPEARLADGNLPESVLPAGDARLEPLAPDRYAYAPSVVGPMQIRTHEDLKRGRLQLLGFDADGTLKAVGRGLRALESRQSPDGSFAASGGRSELGQTALALLPFLGDGHGSRTSGAQSRSVVAPGIAWVRRHIRDTEDGGATTVTTADLGIALKALAEDYMLSYGRLRPIEAERRVDEMARLTERVVAAQEPSGRFPGADEDIRRAVWPMWGLEAAARSGAVLPPAVVAERFRSWYGSRARTDNDEVAAGLLLARTLGAAFGRLTVTEGTQHALARGIDEEDDAFVLATTGTGLLLSDPDAFRSWSRGLDEKLIRSLLQTGVVRKGDPIGDTATVLLALQVAYRTY